MNIDRKTPLILKKNTMSVLNRNYTFKDTPLFQSMQRVNTIKEDVIYTSTPGDFLKGEYPDLTIVNKLNVLSNNSRTTAEYRSGDSDIIELTSDELTKVIGQKNYNTLFAALCSVINQEYRVQAILALLSVSKRRIDISCQTDFKSPENKVKLTNFSCQTDETCFDLIQRLKQKRKIRRPHLTPYVVQEPEENKVKKLVITPKHFKDTSRIIDIEGKIKHKKIYNNSDENYDKDNKHLNEKNTNCALKFPHNSSCVEKASNNVCKDISDESKTVCGNATSFPELRQFVDEDSNISDISCGNISINSLGGLTNLIDNPIDILVNIDKHTQESARHGTTLNMLDGTQVLIPGKTEDHFHIATPDTLKTLSPSERSKVMWYQAYIDWKLCLESDEDGNLPIHRAVLSNDIDMLRRQCVVLKSRQESVDIPANENTALQMAIIQDYASCTAVLLQYGANPLITDDDQRTAVHLAAEMSPDHMKAIINCCQNNARHILEENDLWRPDFETMKPELVVKYLLSKISLMYDSHGYTPLMLASKQGNYANVQMLLESDTSTVNLPMPNCGNTALYEAVATACIDAEKRGNKSKIADNYLKTIETLIKLGADPAIENSSGNSVNHLLNEISNRELSMLVANTIVSLKYSSYDSDLKKDFKSFMLVREQDGDVTIKKLDREKIQVIPKNNVQIDSKVKEKVTPPLQISIDKNDFDKTSPNIKRHVIIPYDGTLKRKADQEGAIAVLPEIKKIKSIKNIIIVPASSASGYMTNIKNITAISKIQSNPIQTRKILKVSKIDFNNLNVSSANVIGSNVISISNTSVVKSQNKNETNHTALPIKKQKRDIQN
ncbi:PREDICTED: uncharacterized protein LOC106107367 isoform X2 [Papilio polytes]|uniref:uncharacterized protein LOC106107367 isoform X2 n=1 Tax=Papilio polytes TaxID=76194 RepID=UPI0006766D2C|nr:PREDICTED: uncharacterized protein LOC106107367 isoform X2 [Papilio polytes]